MANLNNNVQVIKSRRMSWAGHVASMGERRDAYRILVGRPRHRRKDNIKMDLLEMGWGYRQLLWLRIGTGGRHL